MSMTGLPEAVPAGRDTSIRRLLLVWQDPDTRRFAPVGALVQQDGVFVFRYIRRALREPAFRPLVSFPVLDRVYRSTDLPPFFANRVMSPRRPDYPQFIRALDLSVGDAPPFEMLARTGGSRVTDTFHVVAEPHPDADGRVRTLFLAHGIRHVPGALERIAQLSSGDALALRPEPDNEHNALALMLDAEPGHAVGYVPDWMLDVVRDLTDADPDHKVTVELVNGPATPPHLRLLCRLEARPVRTGETPHDPDFDYIAQA